MGKEKILAKVQQSLNKKIDLSNMAPPTYPTINIENNQNPYDSLLDWFIQSSKKNGSIIEILKHKSDIPVAISSFIKKYNLSSMVVGCSLFKFLNWSENSIEYQCRNACGEDQIALTDALFAIADTGTVVINSNSQSPLQNSLLPDFHIIVLSQQQIMGTLSDALEKHQQSFDSAQLTLISGPSRTGDIEMTLVIGAHGPRLVYILLLP